MTQDKMNNQWEEKAREAVYKNLCYPMKDGYYLKGSLRTDDVINCLAKLAESEYLRGRETALSEQSALLDEFAMTLRGLKNFSSPELREFIQKSLDKYESRVDNNGKTE